MDKVKFKATEEQVKQMAVNAIKASIPMGLGHLQYDQDHIIVADMIKTESRGCFVDYFFGRMVKLNIFKDGENEWSIRNELYPDYQSWCRKYKDGKDLVESVDGVEVIQ